MIQKWEFKELVELICEIKVFVLQLNMKELRKFKKAFYTQNYPTWCIDILWEFIFGDRTYEETLKPLQNNKLI